MIDMHVNDKYLLYIQILTIHKIVDRCICEGPEAGRFPPIPYRFCAALRPE
jgi:hypothetical protein